MQELDFSHFDGVLSPIMVLSPALTPLYANRVAMRSYPVLASRGPQFYFAEETLCAIGEKLSNGQAVTLPPDSNVDGEILFNPVFTSKGELSYVLIFAVNPEMSAQEALSLTGDELFRSIQSEIVEPAYDLLRLTDRLERSRIASASDLEWGYTLSVIRKRLVRILRFIVHNSEERPSHGNLVVTDFSAVLAMCATSFPLLDIRFEGRFFVPLSRDRAIHLVVTLLSSVLFSRVKGSHVTVSAERLSREMAFFIRFRRSREFDDSEFSEKDLIGGHYYVLRTLSDVGGHMEITPEEKDVCCIKLFFPEVRFASSEVVLGEPKFGLTDAEDLALRCLRLLLDAEV